MMRGRLLLAALALCCACKGNSASTPPSPASPPIAAAPTPPAEKAKMTEQTPAGAWRSSVADAPLQLTASAAGLTVDWTFTTDSDNAITGALAAQADHTWRGTVHVKTGDEARDAPMTVRFDPATQALHVELAAMFSDAIAFTRATDSKKDDCTGAAADVLAATTAYKKLEAGAPHLRTLPENHTGADRKCDLRVFVDDPSGETRTLGRFRVDFTARQVLQYNPAEDNFTPLANTAELFKP